MLCESGTQFATTKLNHMGVPAFQSMRMARSLPLLLTATRRLKCRPCLHLRFNASTCEQHSRRYCITCSIRVLPREANWQFTTTECTKEHRDFHTGSSIRHSNSQAPIQPVDTSPCRHRHGCYNTVLHTVQVKSELACRCCASLCSHNLCLTWISDRGLHAMTASFTEGLQLPKEVLQIEMTVVQRGELIVCDDLLV